MRIILDSNDKAISSHYLETLVLLYLPGEKFGAGDENTSLFFLVKTENSSVYVRAVLDFCGVTDSEESEVCLPKNARRDFVKSFCGKIFLKLFGRKFGYIPPWGILTGVTPAKFAAGIIRNGKSDTEAVRILEEQYLVSAEKACLAVNTAKFELSVSEAAHSNDYSLYVGIPFCPSRCRYCSFVSYSTPQLAALLPEYISVLCKETETLCAAAAELGLRLKSIYVGGGTPTVLNEEMTERLLDNIVGYLGCLDGVEFTYEAGRPDTVNQKKLDILKAYGVNRVSINTQTTNNEILRSVGRNHSYEDYLCAFRSAKQTGFSVNTDLIAGLPGESTESFCKSVNDVASVSPDNITVHSFSLKKSSEYTVGGQKLDIADRSIEEMIAYSSKKLDECGYFPYYMYRQKNTGGNCENVGYTKNGESAGLYNVYMMEGVHTVLAAGAGASTKLISGDISEKIYNPKYPYEYLRAGSDILKKRESIIRFYKEQNNKK